MQFFSIIMILNVGVGKRGSKGHMQGGGLFSKGVILTSEKGTPEIEGHTCTSTLRQTRDGGTYKYRDKLRIEIQVVAFKNSQRQGKQGLEGPTETNQRQSDTQVVLVFKNSQRQGTQGVERPTETNQREMDAQRGTINYKGSGLRDDITRRKRNVHNSIIVQ